MTHFSEIITIDPTKRFGRPCVSGTRITVYDVLGWLAAGMTREGIIEDFPELSNDSINACLAYAADREHKHRLAS